MASQSGFSAANRKNESPEKDDESPEKRTLKGLRDVKRPFGQVLQSAYKKKRDSRKAAREALLNNSRESSVDSSISHPPERAEQGAEGATFSPRPIKPLPPKAFVPITDGRPRACTLTLKPTAYNPTLGRTQRRKPERTSSSPPSRSASSSLSTLPSKVPLVNRLENLDRLAQISVLPFDNVSNLDFIQHPADPRRPELAGTQSSRRIGAPQVGLPLGPATSEKGPVQRESGKKSSEKDNTGDRGQGNPDDSDSSENSDPPPDPDPNPDPNPDPDPDPDRGDDSDGDRDPDDPRDPGDPDGHPSDPDDDMAPDPPPQGPDYKAQMIQLTAQVDRLATLVSENKNKVEEVNRVTSWGERLKWNQNTLSTLSLTHLSTLSGDAHDLAQKEANALEDTITLALGWVLEAQKRAKKIEAPLTTTNIFQFNKRNLAKFDGSSVEDYFRFRTQFKSLVSQYIDNEHVTDADLYELLRDHCTGNALKVIKGLVTRNDAYTESWNILDELYNKPLQRMIDCMQPVISCKKAGGKNDGYNSQELQRIHNVFFTCYKTIESAGKDPEDSSPTFWTKSREVFPDKILADWDDLDRANASNTAFCATKTDFKEFLAFVLTRIRTLSINEKTNPDRQGQGQQKRTHNTKCTNSTTSNPGQKCTLCVQTGHRPIRCDKWKKTGAQDMIKLLKEKNLCMICAEKHYSKDCPKQACGNCNKKHNSLKINNLPLNTSTNHLKNTN